MSSLQINISSAVLLAFTGCASIPIPGLSSIASSSPSSPPSAQAEHKHLGSSSETQEERMAREGLCIEIKDRAKPLQKALELAKWLDKEPLSARDRDALLDSSKQMDLIDALAADCKGKYANVKSSVKSDDRFETWGAEQYCARAIRARELIESKLPLGGESLAESIISGNKQSTELYVKEGWMDEQYWNSFFLESDAKAKEAFLVRVEPFYKAVKAPVPQKLLADLDASRKEAKAAVDAEISKYPWPKGASNSAFIRAATNRYKTFFDRPVKFIAAFDRDDHWRINKNELDLPKNQSRNAEVVFQVEGDKHCWLGAGAIVQSYAGGGRYQAPGLFQLSGNSAGNSSFRAVRCKGK